MSDNLSSLFPRLRQGDERAAADVFNRFSERLVQLASTRLKQRIQATSDAEDVMQSVWRSFFRRQKIGEFHFENWDEVWSLLVLMTVRACARRANAARAAKRNVDREVRISSDDDSPDTTWQALDRQPLPDEAVMLTDLISHLLQPLDQRRRTMVTLRLQGYSIEEIAEQTGRTQRTVIRVLNLVREALRQQ
ncbi:MAG: sigma-70 family RNA polymerase sigma factor [Pirellulaceae bacterium]